MASQETAKISTARRLPWSHHGTFHCKRICNWDWQDSRQSYHTRPLTEPLTKWCTKGYRHYNQIAYKIRQLTTIWQVHQMTTETVNHITCQFHQPHLPHCISRSEMRSVISGSTILKDTDDRAAFATSPTTYNYHTGSAERKHIGVH